ncbi:MULTISPECIES: hypothetical protein [Methylobacteriaceae]|uniref:hypothetical protein n=1 Tax=Methylobacterium sp. B4 TaxID=1938755 RepID=UPI000D768549|nr:hypothetical protein [Methylobacterium sp. B4]PXW60507.1 hypothetical protein BY998_109110 [Methylobacterium sp. B4]
MTARTDFADRLVELDVAQTRTRLAAALAAVKSHPGYAAGPRAATLQGAVGAVERALLLASRECIQRLDAALTEADRPPATLAEAHADIVAGLDADAPAPPVRRSPPPPPMRGPVPPRPRLPARP